MTQVRALHINDIMRELNLGRATVKFMLERFSDLIVREGKQSPASYSPDTLLVLMRIKNLLDEGLMPSQIHDRLKGPAASENSASSTSASKKPFGAPQDSGRDIRMSADALGFIQDLFEDIKVQQDRIAKAHEKRAQAEERKACAIEKRAEAEAQKAAAMNHIAQALQEMSRNRLSSDANMVEIAGQAIHALTLNETFDPGIDETSAREEPEQETFEISQDQVIDLSSDLDDTDMEDLFDHPTIDVPPADESDLDALDSVNISFDDLLLDDTAPPLDVAPMDDPDEEALYLDDLNLLVDGESDSGDDDLTSLFDTPEQIPELDDLAPLVDNSPPLDLDDLSLLVETPDSTPPRQTEDMDDLSLLLDPAPLPRTASNDIDDLYALVDTPPADLDDLNALIDSPADLDDLSLLIDEPSDLDDLSALVDTPADMDDLSVLIDEPSDMDALSARVPDPPPSLRPNITPEQDLAKYKSIVMKIIIDLKKQGLSAQETTARLNRDEVPTLSGRPRWGEKAISKIYTLIESAK